MAQQKGIIKLKGTLGDITFFKTGDGYLAREKGGVEAGKIANDPAYQRTRENGAEFARAGKGSKLLRAAFQQLIQQNTDRSTVGRLVKLMMAVIKADATSLRGQRNIIDGEADLLEGFEFNSSGKLGGTLFAPSTKGIDRAAGKLTVSLPSFIPANVVIAPAGATHFRIISGGAAIDFEGNNFEAELKNSDILPLDNNATAAIDLVNQVSPNSTHPLFLVMGIEFYQLVNGNHYPLRNGTYNALAIVKVEGA